MSAPRCRANVANFCYSDSASVCAYLVLKDRGHLLHLGILQRIHQKQIVPKDTAASIDGK
jgi:hypothetical protein